MIAQSEDDEGIRPHVLEEKTPQAVHAEVRRLQHPEEKVTRQPVEKIPGRNRDIKCLG